MLNEPVTGEASEAASLFIALADDIDTGKAGLKKPALIVAGGETTVTIRGTGTGGRNQEMALAFACRLFETRQDGKNIFFLSAGTDGIDGPTDAAGAMITPALKGIIRDQGIDPGRYLENNDANRFFEKTGHLIKTGPTGTNVCDLQLLIVN
jgi:hydroxypyruvate reductase